MIEHNGEPLEIETHEVELVSGDAVTYQTWLPATSTMIEDVQRLQCMLWISAGAWDLEPLTAEEKRTGWRTRPHGDHEHTYAVGWRAEQEERARRARIDAEKAACPYRACECGWHED